MGVPQSKPEERVNHINKDLSSLKNSLRISKSNLTAEKRYSIVKNLADQSTEVKSFTGRVKQKKIDETLKKIGDTMQEILADDKNGNVGQTVVDSEVINKRTTLTNSSTRSNKSTKPKNTALKIDKVKRQSIPTLMDIEVKFFDLRPKIDRAIDNRDTHSLRIYQQTIKTIAGDMEMIETVPDTPMDNLKNKLSKQLTTKYQRVTKALKEFRRTDNIQYLAKQTRKSKALHELDKIEIQLAETESLMDNIAKDQNDIDFSTIRENLVEINEKLRSIDCVDDEVKEKIVSLTQKFKEIVKNNDLSITKRDFDYNFSQSVQKLEILINTFDASTDKKQFLNNLENLRQCVEKLEEFNETTKNKKKTLLDQINKHIKEIRSFLRHSERTVDGKTVQAIVEDNVQLRKKVKTSDKEHTVIDQFYNYWSNVKNNFNINSYSNISLLRLDSVLEEMQTSIMDIREHIAEKCDLKNTLDRKISQSMPRLTLNKHNSAYGSHRSLNQINDENKIVRAKVKMYHLSTPELLNAQTEYLDEQHENRRFSKIEEIKTQVYYIKEKINENHNKNLLRDKLEHYLQTLNEFLNDSNKTVANNANIVAKDIHELFHKLYLAELKENLQILAKRSEDFRGSKFDKGYHEIRENLIKLQITLENVSIPFEYKQLEKEKNEMLDATFYYIRSLEDKVVPYHTKDENVKKMHNRLVKAKEQIKRFSGVHRGPLYNAIERDLNKILFDMECIGNKNIALEITQEVEKYLNILEQKASLAQSFRGNEDLQNKRVRRVSATTSIKENLVDIRDQLEKTNDIDQNALEGLRSRLDLVSLELGQINSKSDENLLKERDIFTSEVDTLRNVVEAKYILGQRPIMPLWPEAADSSADFVKSDITKELEIVSDNFEAIKHKIARSNKIYCEEVLSELQELLDKLDKFRFIRNTDLDIQRMKIMNEIVYYKDEIIKDLNEEKSVKKAENILNQIDYALQSNQSVDFDQLLDDIKIVQNTVNSLKSNSSIKDRKINCLVQSEELIHIIETTKIAIANEKQAKIQEIKNVLKTAEEKVKELKQEISAFVGLKSENKFYLLDETITRLIVDLDRLQVTENTLRKRKIATLKELHQQGNILEERAKQTADVVDLEKKLEDITNKTKEFSGSSEDYQSIKKTMEDLGKKVHTLRCNNDLVLRKNACVEKFSVLFNKVLAMGNSLSETKSPSENKTNIAQPVKIEVAQGMTSHVYNFLDKPSPNDQLTDIENEILKCKPQIEKFCNVQQSNEFQEIDDTFTKCTMKLNKLEFSRNSPLDKKKIELMQLIEDFSVLLEKKADDTETISQVESTLKSIGEEMKSTLTDEIVDKIDEILIQTQIKLGKIDNDQLKHRKDACMMSVILYMGQINDFKQTIKSTAV